MESFRELLEALRPNLSANKHDFWDKQPIPHSMSELVAVSYTEIGSTIENKDTFSLPDENISGNKRIEPNFNIPNKDMEIPGNPSLQWVTLNIAENKDELSELVFLLQEHYVEDEGNNLRFAYSEGFLKWALMVPGWNPKLHLGIRNLDCGGALMAFISATPFILLSLNSKIVLVNYLCIHESLRKKNLAPLLISELTRRVNLEENIFQALFSTERALPAPIATCRYFHYCFLFLSISLNCSTFFLLLL